ncbi:MAG: hypothetical protein C6W56_12900 [Caldibacillus debilis]|nr:MAG: hypothetical protein BAA03_00140 [Caldibacillus debilis]REJ26182.1 MAG: hypothetical protein C6W56_12900 [Caldibacillus debilis]
MKGKTKKEGTIFPLHRQQRKFGRNLLKSAKSPCRRGTGLLIGAVILFSLPLFTAQFLLRGLRAIIRLFPCG